MSLSNFNQKRFLLNKMGLGKPQIVNEAQASQNKPINQTPPQPAPKPVAAPKPGCGVCSRRKNRNEL
jgi:hypothetical protein